ncbi:ATP-binding protein [Pararhizobium sp.]|uniref:ATP-binding protein n=1 Tax=Pararhizobium sp. TaxID=1977563 RepID=UPI002716B8E0|nr:ATP-binding protein [Pararhizobium sp.]MDO9418297.1 ATP-binding protein [Pararhizobium sp.]
MPARQYPFIDIAVHERVREHFAKGEAAVLFSTDMRQVLWSNGQGANLFGHDAIYDFIDAGIDHGNVSFRQLEATAAQLKQTGDRRSFLMRIATGFRSVTLNASVEIISVYPGESALLFTTPLDAKPVSRTECAERMLSGFDDPDTHMAVLDADGHVIAASEGFRALGMSEQTSRSLAGAAGQHRDWLVKRPVATEKGNLPAAIGKLSDNPPLYLLFAVETILGNLDAAPEESKTSDTTGETGQDRAGIAEGSGLPAEFSNAASLVTEMPADDAAAEAAEEEGVQNDLAETVSVTGDDLPEAEISIPPEDLLTADASDDAAEEPSQETETGVSSDIPAFEHANEPEAYLPGPITEPVASGGESPSFETTATAEQSENLAADLPAGEPESVVEADGFVFDPQGRAMRFVWKIDAEGRFTEISDEFAAAVGPLSASIAGFDFGTVAERYGFDEDGKIRDLLQRRDTWSGKMILWPVQGTDKAVPVDLAALPTYSRNREFDGFRGFGIVRVADWVSDEKAIGLGLSAGMLAASALPGAADDAPASETPDITTGNETTGSATTAFDDHDAPILDQEHSSGGMTGAEAQDSEPVLEPDNRDDYAPQDLFRGERPVLRIVDPTARTLSDKVIDLEEHRSRGREGLSAGEQAAFREIARKLNETVEDTKGEDTAAADTGIGSTDDQPIDQHEPVANGDNQPDMQDVDAAAPVADDQPVVVNDAPPEDEYVSDAEAEQSPQSPETQEQPPTDHDGADTDANPVEGGFEPDQLQHTEPTGDDNTVIEYSAAPFVSVEDEPVQGEDAAPAEAVFAAADADGGETQDTSAAETADSTPNGLGPEVVDYLPVALLVHSGDVLHHANPEFLKLTGYASLETLIEDGGIDALFAAEDELVETPNGAILLIRNDGRLVPVTARLQSVRWQGKSALMMALAAADTPHATALAETPADVTSTDVFEAGAIEKPTLPDDVTSLKIEVDELRSILETATDGVVTVGADGEIRSMNRSASALFNYDEAETRGKLFAMLFAHESQKAVLDYLNGLSGHGVASVLNDGREVIGRESGGGFIPLFMTMGRLSSSNGYCAVIRDITQWKRTEDELRNAKRSAETANAHKTDFLARVSHEIRTPLNAIIGFSDMMSSERLGPMGHPRYTEYAGDIGRSGRHVLDIVNDLLDISKIEAGEMELEFTAVGLNEMVSEAVSLVQPQANGQRVIVRTSLSAAVPSVVADSRSIKQIALNILANAIRFTPSGGQIVVSTAYEANGSVVLRIRDTGVGMNRAELEQALKPFRQVTSGTRKRGDGTGLGLPLTKAMVDANRAQFSISSTPSEGTLVEVTFPSQRVLAE